MMENPVSEELIFNWLCAWSISRNLPLPTAYKSGFKVDVGEPDQKQRYVFPKLNEDFLKLANDIDVPYIHLKFCGAPADLVGKIPAKWHIQPQGFMMYCFDKMTIVNRQLKDTYKLNILHLESSYLVQIVTKQGVVASEGRLICIEDWAIYDRIRTNEEHKREGLASILMKELEKIAVANQIQKHFLVATEQGKALYEKLGWKSCTLYTSLVILP